MQASRVAFLLKSNSNTNVFLWIFQNFKEHAFWKTSGNGYFWYLIKVFFDHEIISFWICYEKRISGGFALIQLPLDWKIKKLKSDSQLRE